VELKSGFPRVQWISSLAKSNVGYKSGDIPLCVDHLYSYINYSLILHRKNYRKGQKTYQTHPRECNFSVVVFLAFSWVGSRGGVPFRRYHPNLSK